MPSESRRKEEKLLKTDFRNQLVRKSGAVCLKNPQEPREQPNHQFLAFKFALEKLNEGEKRKLICG